MLRGRLDLHILSAHVEKDPEVNALWYPKLCLCNDKLSVLGKRYSYASAGEGRARAILVSFALARVQGSQRSGHGGAQPV